MSLSILREDLPMAKTESSLAGLNRTDDSIHTTNQGDRPPDRPPGEVSARNTLNDLSAREWISESVSVWAQRGLGAGHPDTQIERQHPAPFSFTDVARLIRLFTKRDMTVLDPFAGIGSTLKACALEGRHGIGFELNPTFFHLARERMQQELPITIEPQYVQRIEEGDARVLIAGLKSESIDFIVTSPPYWGILNKKPDHKVKQDRLSQGLTKDYGNDERDFANIASYQQFIQSLADFFGQCNRVLRSGRYCAVIVGDFRHGGQYYMLHADLAHAMAKHGYVLKAVNVLYQRHKRVFPYGYPTAYVPNVHHQNVLIMRKES